MSVVVVVVAASTLSGPLRGVDLVIGDGLGRKGQKVILLLVHDHLNSTY